MSRWIWMLSGVSLVLGGCRKEDHGKTSLIETAIPQRPIVAIVPLLDHSRSNLNWDLSQELSETLRHRLAQKNHLYLVGESSFPNAQKYLTARDPFEVDTSWITKAFHDQEYVVFTELMEHLEAPITALKNDQDSPAELHLSVRVHVFDLREKTAKVILQEIVEQSHHIPRQFTKNQFSQVKWGDEAFDVSPLGIAHDSLCKEVATRIEDYILSGK
jgi:hypothetical protein